MFLDSVRLIFIHVYLNLVKSQKKHCKITFGSPGIMVYRIYSPYWKSSNRKFVFLSIKYKGTYRKTIKEHFYSPTTKVYRWILANRVSFHIIELEK